MNTRKLKKDIDTPFPNEIYSFGCTLRCRLLLMLRNTTDVFRKTMNFDVWQIVDPTKVGVGLSGTIASHKTLTLVVGMTMILDDFRRHHIVLIKFSHLNEPPRHLF